MATDDERREVARRLRENAEAHPDMSLLLNVAFADDSLRLDGAMEWKATPRDAAMRLADLIEPKTSEQTNPRDSSLSASLYDRDALLALADEMEYDADAENAAKCDPMLGSIARMQVKYANRIREALGEGA